MTDSAVSKRAWRAEFNLHRAKKSDRFDRACFLTCNDCAASDSTAMTDGARRDDIVRAIRSGNVAMNCDVSLVIASFARDLETSHASVMEIKGTRFESVVWKEFREHTTHPKVCEAAIEQLSMRDTRATRHPAVCTILNLIYSLPLSSFMPRMNAFREMDSSCCTPVCCPWSAPVQFTLEKRERVSFAHKWLLSCATCLQTWPIRFKPASSPSLESINCNVAQRTSNDVISFLAEIISARSTLQI